MKTLHLFIGIVALTMFSCGTSNKVTQTQIDTLDQMVQNRHFRIESDWAYPLTTGALQQVLDSGLLPAGSTSSGINLIGNPNDLTISGDSITSYLPYFGERQMQVEYGGRDNAIQFDGVMEDYKVEKIKNNSYEITFKAKSKSESFDVYITLSPSLKSSMVLNGNSRYPIRYSGRVEAVEE